MGAVGAAGTAGTWWGWGLPGPVSPHRTPSPGAQPAPALLVLPRAGLGQRGPQMPVSPAPPQCCPSRTPARSQVGRGPGWPEQPQAIAAQTGHSLGAPAPTNLCLPTLSGWSRHLGVVGRGPGAQCPVQPSLSSGHLPPATAASCLVSPLDQVQTRHPSRAWSSLPTELTFPMCWTQVGRWRGRHPGRAGLATSHAMPVAVPFQELHPSHRLAGRAHLPGELSFSEYTWQVKA